MILSRPAANLARQVRQRRLQHHLGEHGSPNSNANSGWRQIPLGRTGKDLPYPGDINPMFQCTISALESRNYVIAKLMRQKAMPSKEECRDE